MLPQSQSGVIVLTDVSSMFADHTREIAAGVVALLEERPVPSGIRPLRQTYLVIAVLSLLLVTFAVRGLVRAIANRGPKLKRSSVITFDIVLPLLGVFMAPRLAGVPLRAMWEGAPDLTLTIAILVVLSFATGAIKLSRRETPGAATVG